MELTKEQLLKKIKKLELIHKELRELGFCVSSEAQVSLGTLIKFSKQYDSKIEIKKRSGNLFPYEIRVPELKIYTVVDAKELISSGLMTREEYLLDQLK